MSSLSVYNVGYRSADRNSSGDRNRDHYLSTISVWGKGTYVAEKKVYHLGEGDSFILLT